LTFEYLLNKILPEKVKKMNDNQFDELEVRITSLLAAHNELRLENDRLRQQNAQLNEERGSFKSRIDSILKKLEGV
jgi:cell division protein ZapB